MPYSLSLSVVLRNAGWRVKIYDAEGPEEPHVSIFRRGQTWRISLRTRQFLDGGNWSELDVGVKTAIDNNWETLQTEWDRLHGEFNPISSQDQAQ